MSKARGWASLDSGEAIGQNWNLRMAIRLIVTVERHSMSEYSCDHRFDLDFSGEMIVLEEGADGSNKILNGRETRWRIEKRPSGLFYCSLGQIIVIAAVDRHPGLANLAEHFRGALHSKPEPTERASPVFQPGQRLFHYSPKPDITPLPSSRRYSRVT